MQILARGERLLDHDQWASDSLGALDFMEQTVAAQLRLTVGLAIIGSVASVGVFALVVLHGFHGNLTSWQIILLAASLVISLGLARAMGRRSYWLSRAFTTYRRELLAVKQLEQAALIVTSIEDPATKDRVVHEAFESYLASVTMNDLGTGVIVPVPRESTPERATTRDLALVALLVFLLMGPTSVATLPSMLVSIALMLAALVMLYLAGSAFGFWRQERRERLALDRFYADGDFAQSIAERRAASLHGRELGA